jgi:hypothetical protein
MSHYTLEASVRKGEKTWSWSGKDSEGNVFALSFPRYGHGIGGVCDVVLAAGSLVPVNDFIKDGRAGRNLLLHKSLVGYKKRFWDTVERESKSYEAALNVDDWMIRCLLEGVIEKAVDWLVSRGAMADSSEVTEEEVKDFKLRLLDVLLLVWTRRSAGRGSKKYNRAALVEMAKMYLVDICRRVRKKGAEPGYRNMLEVLKACKASSGEMAVGCVIDAAAGRNENLLCY